MARLARLYAPRIAQLVHAKLIHPFSTAPNSGQLMSQVQTWLSELVITHKVALHGWILLDDGIFLLATPANEQGVARVMQSIGRNLAATMRSGPVFAGRYHSALLEPGQWVIPALVWIEACVGRSKGLDAPELWPWSSAGIHTGASMGSVAWLTDHEDYWQTGNTPFDRQARYKEKFQEGLSMNEMGQIGAALSGQWALGGEAFLQSLSVNASRRVIPGKRGRPHKIQSGTKTATQEK
ncbi:MAG: hypothetical protein GX070_08735 [Alcaligenaceae bacterium]|nr:hypothetical protein [Alcaligenaceae bacterium]